MFVLAVITTAGLEPAPNGPPKQRKRNSIGVIEVEIDGVAMRVGRGADAGHDHGGDPGAEGGDVTGPTGFVRVMVATRPMDFRKGADGLAAQVRETMGADPFCGAIYVFRARRADPIKPVYFDGTDVCLLGKRLEDGKLCWLSISDGVVRLTAAQLQALWELLDWRRVHDARKTRAPVAQVDSMEQPTRWQSIGMHD